MKPLNISFKEKSIWISLAIILLVFTGYFSQVFDGLVSGTLDKMDVFALFIGAVITIIVLEIALQIVIATLSSEDAQQATDERDRFFAMKAGNISGWILGIGVLFVAAQTFTLEMNSLWVANLLLFVVFVSQVVSYALQIFYYRRGF